MPDGKACDACGGGGIYYPEDFGLPSACESCSGYGVRLLSGSWQWRGCTGAGPFCARVPWSPEASDPWTGAVSPTLCTAADALEADHG